MYRWILGMFILMILLFLAGCWDRRELTDLSFVVAMGVDLNEEGSERYKVSFQIVNPGEVSGQNQGTGSGKRTPVVTFSETGETISEAVRKVTIKVSRSIYFGHLQVLVLGERAAQEGIGGFLDFFDRDHEVRSDFFMLVAREATAYDILKTMVSVELIPANTIDQQIKAMEDVFAAGYGVTAFEFIQSLSSDGKDPVAGVIRLSGNPESANEKENVQKIHPPSYLQLDGMAAFKDEKLAGYLTLKESRGLAWIQDKVRNTVVNVPCQPKGYVTMEVIRSSTKMKAYMKRREPEILIRIRQEANIGEVVCTEARVSREEIIRQLERATEDAIRKEVEDVISKAQKVWKSDIFGFGQLVQKTLPDYWEKRKQAWEEEFTRIRVKVVVDTRIRRQGMRTKSYLEMLKKGSDS